MLEYIYGYLPLHAAHRFWGSLGMPDRSWKEMLKHPVISTLHGKQNEYPWLESPSREGLHGISWGKKMSLSSVSQSNAPRPLFPGLVTSREVSQQEWLTFTSCDVGLWRLSPSGFTPLGSLLQPPALRTQHCPPASQALKPPFSFSPQSSIL